MKTSAVLAGIAILNRYRNNQDGYSIGAEHDAIHAYATDQPVSEDDYNELIKLGWFQEDVETPDGADTVPFSGYSHQDGWTAYV